jgi:hypothetical protein
MKKENPLLPWKEKRTFWDTPTLRSYSVGATTL